MEPQGFPTQYFIWGIDDSPYGPIPLPTLQDWIKDERVLANTWVFARSNGAWQKASEITELNPLFTNGTGTLSESSSSVRIKPGSLRRIKILADLNDAQLAHLVDFLEYQHWLQHAEVVKQGEPGDAMYLIMSGELRARTILDGRETILMTLGPGEFFGEMSLFDHGPRSADVVANVDSTVFRLTKQAFDRLTREMPSLATPILQATSRTLSSRIRADNKRLLRVTQQYAAGERLH